MAIVRRAQERHPHDVVSATVPGFVPAPSAVEGKFLHDTPGWGVSSGAVANPYHEFWVQPDASYGLTYSPHRSLSPPLWELKGILAYPTSVTTVTGTDLDKRPRVVYRNSGTLPADAIAGFWQTGSVGLVSMTRGFRLRIVFGFPTWPSGGRMFAGLYGANVDLSANLSTTGARLVGVCADDTDTYYRWVTEPNGGGTPVHSLSSVPITAGSYMVLDLAGDAAAGTVTATLRDYGQSVTDTETFTAVPDSDVYGSDADPYTLFPYVCGYHAGSDTLRVALCGLQGVENALAPFA